MDFFYSIVGFFASGGVFMYPILLVFAVGVAIAVERYVTLTLVTNKNQAMWNKVQPLLANGEFDEARELTSEDESTISQVLNMGLSLQGAVRRREDIEIAMEESMMEIVPRLEKRTPYVALASSIATLLGLLGTIMGLIQAFTAVANANPAEKADLLSASISVAMNTTAFGLMVAIPLLVVHAVLTSKTGDIVDSLEMATVKALNVFSRRSARSQSRLRRRPIDGQTAPLQASHQGRRARDRRNHLPESDGGARAVPADHGGVLAADDRRAEPAEFGRWSGEQPRRASAWRSSSGTRASKSATARRSSRRFRRRTKSSTWRRCPTMMVELKQDYPDKNHASVLMEPQIPVRLPDPGHGHRAQCRGADRQADGEDEFELVALFSEISVETRREEDTRRIKRMSRNRVKITR